MKYFLLIPFLPVFAGVVFAAQKPVSSGDKVNVWTKNAHDNFTELYTHKANASAFASQAAFTSAWGWTPGISYTLPTATSDILGGIKVGSRLTITNGVLSADVQSGTGAVDSVNSQTGVVVLDADDISDTSTAKKFVTAADLTKLGNTSGTNTGDQDLSVYLSKTNTTAFTPTADYHPATKKYVDDSITAGGGYTDEQAQDAVGGMFSGNTETGVTVTYDDATGKVNFVVPTTLASFTDDSTHRLVTDTEKSTWNAKQNALLAGTDYLTPTGSAAGLTNFPTLNQNTTGSAAKLTTARTIGGVSFDGSANINLPGVNAAGNQNTTGNATTATSLSANPTDCTAGQYATTIAANGDLTCAQVAYSQIGSTPTLGTAAALNVGTSAYNIPQLNSFGELPYTIPQLTSLQTASGISSGATNLGTFTGSIIADGSATVKSALQELETAVESLSGGGLTSAQIDTSSELRGIVTDESGTGALLFAGGDIGAGAATTPSANDNDTSIATTAYVQTELTAYASDAVTFTNKAYDTVGAGNSLTVPLNGILNGAITDPADADDMIYVKAPNAMTITDIHCLAEGGGTITITLQECSASGGSCANIEGAITCDADGAEDDGTLTDGAIAAGAWIKVLYSAPTGTVNNVAWTVYGTQTW